MSGQHTRYQFLLRQRFTATALNTQADYTARLTYAALQALVAADGQYSSGVIDGLLPTIQAGTMNVVVGGGLGLMYDGVLSLPDATHRWIEIQHSAPITVTLDTGDVQPRWDLIEIAAAQVDGPPEVLDFFDPALGVAVPLAASPVKVCTPVVHVTKGTPSASPRFPATGGTKRIPLAYVYVPAAAVSLNPLDIAYCRPIRKPRSFVMTPTTIDLPHRWQIKGGGLQVSIAGLQARVVNEMSGSFPGSSTPFALALNQVCQLSVNNYDGGGLPGTSRQVYAYAIKWPFPAGSEPTLAPREFYLRNPALMTAGGYAVGQQGCMVVWSSTAPSVSNQGPGNAGGSASFNHPNVGAFTVPYEEMVYVGSAMYDQPLNQLVLQRAWGSIVGSPRKTGADFEPDLPIAAPISYILNASLIGQPVMRLPAHVTRVRVVSRFNIGVNTWIYAQFADQFETGAGAKPVMIYDKRLDANALQSETGCDFWAHLDNTQAMSVKLADANLAGPCVLFVWEWQDPIIAMR